MREGAPGREAFRIFRRISTRWSDNDVYGHINNVRYYSFFDTAVNGWLIEEGFLDIAAGRAINLVVETNCRYFAPLSFPAALEAGIAVARLGTSSVTYHVGIFPEAGDEAAAAGRFTHVHVDRDTRRPLPIPQEMRQALDRLVVE